MCEIVAKIQTLIAAIETNYMKEQFWQNWSERQLLEISSVPVWLVELYDAKNKKVALDSLYKGWQKINKGVSILNQTELHLGFLYLNYLDGDLNIAKLLLESANASERGNFDNPSCEEFYALLNEYEQCGNAPPYNPKTFSKRVNELFLTFAEIAKKQMVSLQ